MLNVSNKPLMLLLRPQVIPYPLPKRQYAKVYTKGIINSIRSFSSLTRRDQHPLLLRIVLPASSSHFASMFLRIASDSCFKLGTEMADETLKWPGEGFTECYSRVSVSV